MGRLSLRRRACTIAIAALTAVAGMTAPAPAHAAPTDARSLLGAVQGGELIGTPPLPYLVAGAGATLTSPEFWSEWVRGLVRDRRILVPHRPTW